MRLWHKKKLSEIFVSLWLVLYATYITSNRILIENLSLLNQNHQKTFSSNKTQKWVLFSKPSEKNKNQSTWISSTKAPLISINISLGKIFYNLCMAFNCLHNLLKKLRFQNIKTTCRNNQSSEKLKTKLHIWIFDELFLMQQNASCKENGNQDNF